MEIAKMLVLSTAHLTPATCCGYMADTLAAYAKAEYGWFVDVPSEGQALVDGYPLDLAVVLAFARGAGMQWVMFDRDGDELAELPVYDWNAADDGCPKGDPDCTAENGACHDACSTFAQRAHAAD